MDNFPGYPSGAAFCPECSQTRVSCEGEIRVEHHRISTEHNAFPGIPLRMDYRDRDDLLA